MLKTNNHEIDLLSSI